MTPSAAQAEASSRLLEAGIDGAPRDARRLLAHALGLRPERLVVDAPSELTQEQLSVYREAIARRAAREPVSHITGERLFYGRTFRVTPDVLDPRPETETLVEAALTEDFRTVLDLGTGSGCILLTLLGEREAATGTGADLSEAALSVALENAVRLGLDERASLVLSDWVSAISGEYDLIVSNPPYISDEEMLELSPEVLREPRMALTPGGDGLSPYRIIANAAPGCLTAGGRLLVEIGWRQGLVVRDLFVAAGFEDVRVLKDLDGRDRVVSGRSRCAEMA